jgi:hypothetical protein
MRTTGVRLSLVLITLLLVVGACSTREVPTFDPAHVDCQIAGGCDGVLAAAAKVVSLDQARVLVGSGRGLGFHAEVHVCYADGRYVLIDVMGDALNASVRAEPWPSAPCR